MKANLSAAPVLAERPADTEGDPVKSGAVIETGGEARESRSVTRPDALGGHSSLSQGSRGGAQTLSRSSGNAAGSSAEKSDINYKKNKNTISSESGSAVVSDSGRAMNDVHSPDFISLMDAYFGNWSVEERRSFPCWSGHF